MGMGLWMEIGLWNGDGDKVGMEMEMGLGDGDKVGGVEMEMGLGGDEDRVEIKKMFI